MRKLLAGLLLAFIGETVRGEDMRIVDRVKDEHPRIILTNERVDELKALMRTDADLRRIVEHIEQLGDYVCGQPPVERKLIGTKRFRLLGTSRLVLSRVLTLGTLYRLDGQAKWKGRLLAELKAVCGFADWYPRHFLDTAEMSAAVALGYDWLYTDLSDEDRRTIRDGLVRHGVIPGLEDAWWVKAHNNWNQVCHCGMVLAALAVAEDEPEHAASLLQRAKAHHGSGLGAYAPAGVYPEGPGYWNYGTSFSVIMASALESAVGDDWGILDRPGFRASFDFRIHVQGPTGKVVNYADGSAGAASSPYHFHIASRSDDSGHSTFAMQSIARDLNTIARHGDDERLDRKVNRLLALSVAWYVPEKPGRPRPVDWSGRGDGQVHVAFMRSAWQDPDALFASLKGGRLQVNHGHLDSGSFVVEADGVRWASDLGSEKEIYDRNDSWSTEQHSPRWEFFRANNFSHNTLTIDGELQRVEGVSPITATGTGESPFAIVDLSAAYAGQAQSVKRGVMMPARKAVLVRDEVLGVAAGKTVRWNMMTRARPEVGKDGKTAVLHARGKTMTVKLLSPGDACFDVLDAKPKRDDENPNAGRQRLVVDAPSPGGELVVSVLFVPENADVPERQDRRLEEWGRERPRNGHQVKTLPMPGEVFAVAGHTAFLIQPEKHADARATPWVWYAPTLEGLPGDAEIWMFERFLAAGIGIAGVDVGESYGSPDGVAVFAALYDELVAGRGMSKTPALLARSRGGLMLYNWAVANAAKVACIAGIYPVCNIASYPGLDKACGAYGMSETALSERLSAFNPGDRLGPLAEAGVPIFHIHGDNDTVVPLDQNSEVVRERYEGLGGEMTLDIVEGGGHDMKSHWFQSDALVRFVLTHCRG